MQVYKVELYSETTFICLPPGVVHTHSDQYALTRLSNTPTMPVQEPLEVWLPKPWVSTMVEVKLSVDCIIRIMSALYPWASLKFFDPFGKAMTLGFCSRKVWYDKYLKPSHVLVFCCIIKFHNKFNSNHVSKPGQVYTWKTTNEWFCEHFLASSSGFEYDISP